MYKDPQSAAFNSALRSIHAEGNTIPDNECDMASEYDTCDELLNSMRHERNSKPKPRMKPAGRSEGVYCYSGG